MPPTPSEFAAQLANPIGGCYLLAAAANIAVAGVACKQRSPLKCLGWSAIAVGFAALAVMSFCGSPLQIPHSLKTAIDAALTPAVLTFAFFAAFFCLFVARVLRQSGGFLDRFQRRRIVLGRIADRSELFCGSDAARRRADRGVRLPAGILPLAGNVSSRAKRPPIGERSIDC